MSCRRAWENRARRMNEGEAGWSSRDKTARLTAHDERVWIVQGRDKISADEELAANQRE